MQLFETDRKFAHKHEAGFDGMSEDEKTQAATDWLTKKGAIVISQEDPGDAEEIELEEDDQPGDIVNTEPVEVSAKETGKVVKLTPQAEKVEIPQDSPFGAVAK